MFNLNEIMGIQQQSIFGSRILIVSENQSLANILKEQCMLYGFSNVHITSSWKTLGRSLEQEIPDIIVTDQIPGQDEQARDLIPSTLSISVPLPVIFYAVAPDPEQISLPHGFTVAATLFSREQQQQLLEIIHAEMDKRFVDTAPLPEHDAPPIPSEIPKDAEQYRRLFHEFIRLKESEENLRTLVDTSGDIVFRISPQGIVNFTSPAVQEQLGYTREDLEKERINIAKFVNPQDLMRVMAAIRQVIRGNSIKGLECRLMHQDRAHFHWYSINCYPMYNKLKQFVGVGGIARDIGSIKKFETRIQKQNERLATLNTVARIVTQSLNLDDILTNVLDTVLEIVYVQAGSMFLFASGTDDLILKSCRRYSAQEGATDCTQIAQQHITQKIQEKVCESTMPRVLEDLEADPIFQGTEFVNMGIRSLVSIPLKSKDVLLGTMLLYSTEQREIDGDDLQLLVSIGNQVGMMIENITLYQQEQQARERLEELNKLKDDFLSIVSHDMRSPLTAILGASELLLDDMFLETPLSQEQRELVDNIHTMGQQQLHLVNDLLDLAKIESGKLELNPTRTYLHVVAEQCYTTLKLLAEKKNISMTFSAQNDLPKVSFDVPKISQVINNLVGNAIKFTKPGGTITLSVQQENDDVLVSVSDTGEGIEPEHLSGLFSKFQQLKSVGTGGERGSGLGLSICKNLVELHQGKIWVESRIGVGSTFSFTLPITEDVILIIDDSPFVVRSLEKILLEHIRHIKVVHALNGPEGIERVEELSPLVIVLDYMMPDMNGIEVFQEMLNRFGMNVPPTIFLTASQDLDVRRRIFELGADDYLQKPVDIHDLLPRISRFL